MMTMTEIEPVLAPPGAGLPKPELFIARLLLALRRWRGNREKFTANFQRQRAAIRGLVQCCGAEKGARRVLIPRLPGLEDSSRHWSVWMTLDHLRMVNQGIARTIGALTFGKTIDRVASTAAVKPSPDASASVVVEYEKSCEAVLAAVERAPNLKTKGRYAHPWFGSLDASGWHALAGSHMALHRGQIERILQGLAGPENNL